MNKTGQIKKDLRLNETDRRILQAYTNALAENASRPAAQITMEKKVIKLS